MKKVYIVLTHTGTILSRIVRMLTKNKYTHASISLDVNMDGMYSFGRLNPYNPFLGGFVQEGINIGTFRRFKNTRTAIYSLKVTDEQYDRLKEIIKTINTDKDIYKFNVLGLIFALFDKRYIRENRFYCSEFVRHTLEESKIEIKGICNVIKPEDFRRIKKMRLVYSGLLRDYGYNNYIRNKESINTLEMCNS